MLFTIQDVDLFATYEVDRMFVFHMIAVDSDFGGRGIGTGLVKHGIDHATRHGFRVLTAETTGITSAKIFQVDNRILKGATLRAPSIFLYNKIPTN